MVYVDIEVQYFSQEHKQYLIIYLYIFGLHFIID